MNKRSLTHIGNKRILAIANHYAYFAHQIAQTI